MSLAKIPTAAVADAIEDAHAAGCCAADVELLQEIGSDLAGFARQLAEKLNRLEDGRMATRWTGKVAERRPERFDVAEMVEGLAEFSLSHLDAFPLILASAALAMAEPAASERRAA